MSVRKLTEAQMADDARQEAMAEEAAGELQRKHCVALLEPYVRFRRERDQIARKVSGIAGLLKLWLDRHPEEELRDGERGIRGFLQSRRGEQTLDVIRLAEEQPNVVLRLAALGLLKLDLKAFEQQETKFAEAVAARQFMYPGPGSVALRVEEEK